MMLQELNNLTVQQIEEIAEKLRVKVGIAEANFIDITEMAEEMGFEVFEADFEQDDLLGSVVANKTEKTIYVDENLNEMDKRYAVATQLAHVILGHSALLQSNEILTDYRSTYKGCNKISEWGQKAQAAALASALLMPKQLTVDAWNKGQNVDIVAEYFKVTKKVAYMRLDNLGLI